MVPQRLAGQVEVPQSIQEMPDRFGIPVQRPFDGTVRGMNMVQITMKLPDQLAGQILPRRRWLPVVLELSLARLKTPAAETSSEIMDFFLLNQAWKMFSPTTHQIGRSAGCTKAAGAQRGRPTERDRQEELAEMERLEHSHHAQGATR
ncbi:hypothetical protein [Candidatus Amarolinea dominans]|uniref:hypothetical protein n=1 Tax=Candidatus Amarolinea dominans TaxID=3140696 RepID=UPI003134F272|nr:hypothetical protein [Anaerolineae bacterium]